VRLLGTLHFGLPETVGQWVIERLLTSHAYSLAPYEKRIIELLRNSKDKRARRLAKKRVRLSLKSLHDLPPLAPFTPPHPNIH
jgi:hypothetical protein